MNVCWDACLCARKLECDCVKVTEMGCFDSVQENWNVNVKLTEMGCLLCATILECECMKLTEMAGMRCLVETRQYVAL